MDPIKFTKMVVVLCCLPLNFPTSPFLGNPAQYSGAPSLGPQHAQDRTQRAMFFLEGLKGYVKTQNHMKLPETTGS